MIVDKEEALVGVVGVVPVGAIKVVTLVLNYLNINTIRRSIDVRNIISLKTIRLYIRKNVLNRVKIKSLGLDSRNLNYL